MSDSSPLYVNVFKNKYYRKSKNEFSSCKFALTVMQRRGKDDIEKTAELLQKSNNTPIESHSDDKFAHVTIYCKDINDVNQIATNTIGECKVLSNIPYRNSSVEEIMNKARAL